MTPVIVLAIVIALVVVGFFWVKSHKDKTTAELKRLEDRINRL